MTVWSSDGTCARARDTGTLVDVSLCAPPCTDREVTLEVPLSAVFDRGCAWCVLHNDAWEGGVQRCAQHPRHDALGCKQCAAVNQLALIVLKCARQRPRQLTHAEFTDFAQRCMDLTRLRVESAMRALRSACGSGKAAVAAEAALTWCRVAAVLGID